MAGTTNYLELKAADPDYWNMYKRRLTYTCPRGYVLEQPAVHYEQPDPIPEELDTFEVECAANAVWTPRPLNGLDYMPYCIRNGIFLNISSSCIEIFLAINCTEAPFPSFQNDLLMSNWTGIAGVHPRPFATAIKYYCRREGWGFPSTGLNETQISCLWDGQWSNDVNIETCISKNQTDQTDHHPIISELPCKTPPPPSLPGEGAEMNYGPEVTTYRCPNGLEWSNGQWPYLENECLNKKWQYRTSLPACRSQLSHFIFYIFQLNFPERSCGQDRPEAFMGMDIDWPYR